MNLTHEYMHHRTGYRLGAGCCWIRIYKGVEGDAPVVVCEQLPRVGDVATREVSGFLAAEVIREHCSEDRRPKETRWATTITSPSMPSSRSETATIRSS